MVTKQHNEIIGGRKQQLNILLQRARPSYLAQPADRKTTPNVQMPYVHWKLGISRDSAILAENNSAIVTSDSTRIIMNDTIFTFVCLSVQQINAIINSENMSRFSQLMNAEEMRLCNKSLMNVI